jgi:hypothetical protein
MEDEKWKEHWDIPAGCIRDATLIMYSHRLINHLKKTIDVYEAVRESPRAVEVLETCIRCLIRDLKTQEGIMMKNFKNAEAFVNRMKKVANVETFEGLNSHIMELLNTNDEKNMTDFLKKVEGSSEEEKEFSELVVHFAKRKLFVNTMEFIRKKYDGFERDVMMHCMKEVWNSTLKEEIGFMKEEMDRL